MNEQHHSLAAWLRDVAIAYAGGLVLGAPVAVAAVRLTGRDGMATLAMLLAMVVVFLTLRRAPGRRTMAGDVNARGVARPSSAPAGRRAA